MLQDFLDLARDYYAECYPTGDFDEMLQTAPHYGHAGNGEALKGFATAVYAPKVDHKTLQGIFRKSRIYGTMGRRLDDFKMFHAQRRQTGDYWDRWVRLGTGDADCAHFLDVTLRRHEDVVRLVAYLDVAYASINGGVPGTSDTGWAKLAARWYPDTSRLLVPDSAAPSSQ